MRRVTRIAPRVSGLGIIARSVQASSGPTQYGRWRQPNRRPPSPAQWRYMRTAEGPLPNGYSSAKVASNAATVYVGPMGTGTIWYPTMAVIGTTTGANDASTCTLYLSPLLNGTSLASQPQIGGQSYAGGGDTIGLSIPPVYPGYYLIAVWAGAVNGDLATLTVYGSQQSLVT